MKLSKAIASVPAGTFFTGRGDERKPDYPAILVHAMSEVFKARGVKYDKGTLEKVAEHLNPSTFQRQVAIERGRRDENGGTGPVPAKAKKARPNPIDGGMRKRGVDPISGKTKREAKAEAKAAKVAKKAEARAAKVKKPTPKKAEARAAKKPAKAEAKAARKPEADPISGEPVPVH